MSHLSSEILRRYVDEPDLLLSYEKEHLLSCVRCRAQLEGVREHAQFAAAALAGDEEVDVAAARDVVMTRSEHAEELRFAKLSIAMNRAAAPDNAIPIRWAAAIAAAAIIALVIAYTPLRSYAQNFLTVFQPRQFHGVGLTRSDFSKLHSLPDLEAFGTMRQTSRTEFARYLDAAAASRHAHMTIAVPDYLPAAVARKAMYHVSTLATATFTFSAAKARAFGRRSGQAVPPMSANLDGARLSAAVGPVVVQTYGEQRAWELETQSSKHARRHHVHSEGLRGLPADTIIITQVRAPQVTSSGATVAQIESYLLNMPGVPADLATQIRSIGDPASTVPVPFRIDKENAQTVSVQGAQALLIGDNTGIGSGVVWQRNGIIYGVAGPFAASEILQVANSLKP